jgi:HEAT repeat protein
MSTPAGILADLASMVLLLRDQPDRTEEQQPAFERVAAGLSRTNHVLKVTPAGFSWDDVAVPADRGDLAALQQQLRVHDVGEIRLPAGLMPSTLLSLVRVLAAPAGTYGSFDHLVARLDAAGCGIIPVLPMAAPRSGPAARRSGGSAPSGKVDDEGRIAAIGPDALTEAKVGLMHFASLQPHTVSPASELVERLKSTGSGAAGEETLNQLIAAGELAARQREWHEVLRAAHGLVELEKQGGKAAAARGYGIALRRLLPRSALEQLARLTAQGNLKAEATAVLRRMGADGTEALLHLLVNSEDMTERRAYFSALREMTEGGELLVHMLSHDQWFVVRNVADLCGELGLESSVHALARLVNHDDERVRRAVAGALAHIGGTAAAEPLRRALRDSAAPVRLEAAQRLDGRKNKGLAMSLALAAEAESKPDVQRAMYLALGRIGSPEAIQALRKAAEPGGRFFRRKPTAVRLAAVDGLHAAGPSATNELKALLEDEEREVREAVERALQTLWE